MAAKKLKLKYFRYVFFLYSILNLNEYNVAEVIRNIDWNEKNIENINDKITVFWVK